MRERVRICLLVSLLCFVWIVHGKLPPLLGSSCRTHSNIPDRLDGPHVATGPRRAEEVEPPQKTQIRPAAKPLGISCYERLCRGRAGRSLSLSKLASIAAPAISSPRALLPAITMAGRGWIFGSAVHCEIHRPSTARSRQKFCRGAAAKKINIYCEIHRRLSVLDHHVIRMAKLSG